MHKRFYIVGATSSGKSSLAIEIAKQIINHNPNIKVSILNADVFQLYKGLEILTASPSEAQKNIIPHYLYNQIPPQESINFANYSQLANKTLKNISGITLIVGGSGMYIKSLTHGISEDIPESDPVIRNNLNQLDYETLLEKFLSVEKHNQHKINLKNRRHIQRAYEIYLMTGKSAFELKKNWEKPLTNINGIFLYRDMNNILDRIEKRTQKMISQGVIEEVNQLISQNSIISTNLQKAIGFYHISEYLKNNVSKEELIEKIILDSRKYAKRQNTWFKKQNYFIKIIISEKEDLRNLAKNILLNNIHTI